MTIIIGLEGVLARHEWRLPLIESEGWQAYHEAASRDAPNEPMVDLVRAMSLRGCYVACITARPQSWYSATSKWMLRHGLLIDTIYMRADDDFRPDAAFRSTAVKEILDKAKNVLFAIDDAEKACDVYRAAGIPTLQLTNPSNHND